MSYDHDWMPRRGGWRPYGALPPRPRPRYGYDFGWRGAVQGSRRMRFGRWEPPRGWSGGGYDRGAYGPAYEGPAYGARPSQARGYDRGFAREPFVPEEAYRRHPEYGQPRHGPQRWNEGDYRGEPTDDDLAHAVRARMYQDAWLDVDRIDVAVEDGVVTLTGEVDDFLEARYAWDDAWETPGVRGVVNQLTVRTDRPGETHGDVVPQTSGDPSPARAESLGDPPPGEGPEG
ncbi:MAG TPA: BON domain-containing protein [Longimicrobiaceae bacterium]|nr:BON domain-containing protein [Longimicrobiaceae bacterium]